MKKANIVQGEKYIFDKPEEDPYDRLIIDNLIKTKIYDIIINKKNDITIIRTGSSLYQIEQLCIAFQHDIFIFL
jgi:hypothetical protein